MAQLVGAEYVVMDDLNNGPSKPVQIRFYGSDSRQLLTITQDFMAQLRQVPGAVDVGLSQKDPQKELQIELDRGLANALGITAADVTNALRVAFAGIEVGDWVDPPANHAMWPSAWRPRTVPTPPKLNACPSRSAA